MAKKSRANRVVGISGHSMTDWQTEDDLRTLQQACAIKKDKKRMAKVAALAKEKLLAMADIAADAKEGGE